MKVTYTERKLEILALILLSVATFIASMFRFGRIYPDSSYYLLLVDFFRGTVSGTELISPFCYRPLLPFIAALIPVSAEISIPFINLIFEFILAWVLFYLAREFGFSVLSSLASSGVCSFSLTVAFYGPAVLVDVGAVLFLALGMLLMLRDESGYKVSVLLTIGVLFKEIALIGVLAYFFYRKTRDLPSLSMAMPVIVYLLVRLITPSANPGYTWEFHLLNFTTYSVHTFQSLLFGLGPFVLVCIPAFIRKVKEPSEYSREFRWMLVVGIPALGVFGLGLFWAFFDARFIWPLYIALVPMMAAGSSEVLRLLKIEKKVVEISDGEQLKIQSDSQ